jgi:hypothetical protein
MFSCRHNVDCRKQSEGKLQTTLEDEQQLKGIALLIKTGKRSSFILKCEWGKLPERYLPENQKQEYQYQSNQLSIQNCLSMQQWVILVP